MDMGHEKGVDQAEHDRDVSKLAIFFFFESWFGTRILTPSIEGAFCSTPASVVSGDQKAT